MTDSDKFKKVSPEASTGDKYISIYPNLQVRLSAALIDEHHNGEERVEVYLDEESRELALSFAEERGLALSGQWENSDIKFTPSSFFDELDILKKDVSGSIRIRLDREDGDLLVFDITRLINEVFHICEECDKRYKRFTGYKEHMTQHKEEKQDNRSISDKMPDSIKSNKQPDQFGQ